MIIIITITNKNDVVVSFTNVTNDIKTIDKNIILIRSVSSVNKTDGIMVFRAKCFTFIIIEILM